MNLLDDAADRLREELLRRGWKPVEVLGLQHYLSPDGRRRLCEEAAFAEVEAPSPAPKDVRCDTHQPPHVGCPSCHRLWRELLEAKTLLRWEATELTEGQAAKVLGLDRVSLRELRQSVLSTLHEEPPQ